MPTNKLNRILRKYRDSLEHILGTQLDTMLLYGSQARGNEYSGSDVDIACVMRGSFDFAEMIERTSEITASLSLKHDITLSRTFIGKGKLKDCQLPFYVNIRRDGIPV